GHRGVRSAGCGVQNVRKVPHSAFCTPHSALPGRLPLPPALLLGGRGRAGGQSTLRSGPPAPQRSRTAGGAGTLSSGVGREAVGGGRPKSTGRPPAPLRGGQRSIASIPSLP